jgi:trans-aconitate methyltransferase
MTPAAARALIAHPSLGQGGPLVWADLGCGRGTFTVALAGLLPDGSTIHAVDADGAALAALPRTSHRATIVPHVGDFVTAPWPRHDLHGVLMANALHYVRDQDAFLDALVVAMEEPRLLLVEYDTDTANPWVPYPISRTTVSRRLANAGLNSVIDLGRRGSVFRRAEIYAILATAADASAADVRS